MVTGRIASACRRAWMRSMLGQTQVLSEEQMARSALILAPHPDDEVLGCGGTVLAKRAVGARIGIVHVTDGRGSHSRYLDVADLSVRRRAEACEAARRLGVADEDLYFLDLEDGLVDSMGEKGLRPLVAILREFEPEQLFIPYRHDGVTDHEATWALAMQALQERGGASRPEVLEYLVWFWHRWPFTEGRVRNRFPRWVRRMRHALAGFRNARRHLGYRVDIREQIEAKHRALAAHVSQMEKPEGDTEWPILSEVADGDWLALFFGDFEWFHRQDPEM